MIKRRARVRLEAAKRVAPAVGEITKARAAVMAEQASGLNGRSITVVALRYAGTASVLTLVNSAPFWLVLWSVLRGRPPGRAVATGAALNSVNSDILVALTGKSGVRCCRRRGVVPRVSRVTTGSVSAGSASVT